MLLDPAATTRQFHDNGFAIVRSVFNDDEIARFSDALDTVTRDVAPRLGPGEVYYEDTPERPIKSLFRLENHSDVFASLVGDARLLTLVRAVYDDPDARLRTAAMFAKPARHGSVTPAHQDNVFQCWDPPEALTITVAVDPSTCDNGPLVCQKGSHRLGLLPHRPSGVMGFSQMLIDPLDTGKWPEVELCLEPGDISRHATETVHRSGPNGTDQSRRQIAVGAYSSRAKVDEKRRARRNAIVAKLHDDHER
ncbi:MAG: hypothetical protein CMJ18_16635 [Phycisphaeraceae bacterium]|nr:hypothetical protein [Phycisphaeraceae bacterium]